jgi:hypothetical protein
MNNVITLVISIPILIIVLGMICYIQNESDKKWEVIVKNRLEVNRMLASMGIKGIRIPYKNR